MTIADGIVAYFALVGIVLGVMAGRNKHAPGVGIVGAALWPLLAFFVAGFIAGRITSKGERS